MPCRLHKQDGRVCDDCADYNGIRARVLVIKLGAAGDVVRTTAILPAVHRRYPHAHVTWITEAAWRPLLDGNPLIDRPLVRGECLDRLLVESFDVTFALDPDETCAALAAVARSRERIGFVLDDRGRVQPASPSAVRWWQMGLNDGLKRANRRTYQDLLYELCGLDGPVARPQLAIDDDTRARV